MSIVICIHYCGEFDWYSFRDWKSALKVIGAHLAAKLIAITISELGRIYVEIDYSYLE